MKNQVCKKNWKYIRWSLNFFKNAQFEDTVQNKEYISMEKSVHQQKLVLEC